jgi:outer membrane protein assembly factor BamB
MKAVSTFESPCEMPNGLQWFEGELFVMDQLTDNVLVLDKSGKLLRTINTPTENGSGITVGGGYLWTASNGGTVSRPYRATDTHLGYIYKLDMKTGKMVDRYRTPDGGGIHGIEWDNGLMWVTAFSPKALHLCDPSDDMKIIKTFPVSLERLHGLARDGDGIWCAHTTDNVIVKYNVETGAETDRITMNDNEPFVHGLSILDGQLWFADANFAGKHGTAIRGNPAIGKLVG